MHCIAVATQVINIEQIIIKYFKIVEYLKKQIKEITL